MTTLIEDHDRLVDRIASYGDPRNANETIAAIEPIAPYFCSLLRALYNTRQKATVAQQHTCHLCGTTYDTNHFCLGDKKAGPA